MCLYRISFLKPLDGNICLLTPPPKQKYTIGLLHPCALRKWILSVRTRGFPGGEVHGGDKKFEKSRNADAGSCRAGQGYSSLPKEAFYLCVGAFVHVWLRVHEVSHVYAWTLLLLTRSTVQLFCYLGLNACWLQQHFNILQRGLSSQFSSLIYCYSQQLSQPICKDVIFKPQRIRKDFICCQERHHRAQTQFLLSLSFPVTEAVRFLLINVTSC